jgi:phage tail sheath protein FI
MAGDYRAPGVYIEEVAMGPRPIQAAGTSTAGFVGRAPASGDARMKVEPIANWSQFRARYVKDGSPSTPLSNAVFGFFLNGGMYCYVVDIGDGDLKDGLDRLSSYDEVAIVAAPGCTDAMSYEAVLAHCETAEDRVAVLDAPEKVPQIEQLTKVATASPARPPKDDKGDAPKPPAAGPHAGLRPRQSDAGFGAVYWPWIVVRDPLGSSSHDLISVPPSGHVAGIYARTDAARGVFKAPANETVVGAVNVTHRVTHEEQKILNPSGVNCIRFFPQQGIRVFGARTLADSASEWCYVNVRRLFNMVEESIAEGTRWVVFEPNDRTLWKSVTRDTSAFLNLLWRQGALLGDTPEQAYYVKCDEETNPREVINAGRVVIEVGIAPVKPAEFIIFRIGQWDGGIEKESASEAAGTP